MTGLMLARAAVTLHEIFANWVAASNRNRCLGVARTLLYTVRRRRHSDEYLELLVSP